MPGQVTHRYAAAGGVVINPAGDRVLILVVPGRATPEGLAEVRLPKGHIEPGESPADAAVREVLEETGLVGVEVIADLGHQFVEFGRQDRLVIRDESYFLMRVRSWDRWGQPEAKYERSWVTWVEAVEQLTYEPEREWVRRGRRAWAGR